MAAVTFWGVLWLEGANDVLADQLQIPLFTLTWIARVAVFVAPAVAYWVTKRICLGLQRKDAHLLEHGVETGIIRQLPTGEYVELTRPVDEEKRAVLEYNRVGAPEQPAIPPAEAPDEVPAPGTRGALGRLQLRANRLLTEGIPVTGDGHGNGHGDGHGNGHAAPAAVTAGEQEGDQPDGPAPEQDGPGGTDTGH